MPTGQPIKGQRNQSGFALIAVLFTLMILVLLFSSASRNFMAHNLYLGPQVQKEKRDLIRQSISAMAMLAMDASEHETEFEIAGQNHVARLQDVGGLVDLNYASPGLLAALIRGLGYSALETEAGVTNIRQFRETGAKLLRASDFWRISQLEEIAPSNIINLTTVYSGKSGVAPEQAPIELLEVLTGNSGTTTSLQSTLPETFVSLASGSAFNLLLNASGYSQEKLLASIQFDPSNGTTTVLFLH